MTKRPPRVGFVSLGCPKALVDSERIVTELRAEGYLISSTYKDFRSVERKWQGHCDRLLGR